MPRFRKDLSGERIGKIQVISHSHSKGSRHYWNCRCDCGRDFVTTFQIKDKIQSCRHCHKGVGKNHYAWKGCGDLPRDIYNTYRHGAEDRDLCFEVSIEHLWDLFEKQEGKCAMTGWPIAFNKEYRKKNSRTASLDRIDSTQGYIEGNLQWVHRDINKLKKNMDNDRFIELCIAVSKQLGGAK